MNAPSGRRRRPRRAVAAIFAVGLLGAAAFGFREYRRLSTVVDQKFGGRRWDFPSRILSDEFLVHLGQDVDAAGVPRRLERLGYRRVVTEPRTGGEVRLGRDAIEIALRAGAQGREETQRVRLALDGRIVASITDLDRGETIAAVALEPEEITGIWSGEWEQRRAVRVVDVAPILVKAILVTEDARFFDHHGVDLVGVGRAAVANLRSGRVLQGGSTLTQQLMKNFFLSGDRTLRRKLAEVAMALVAEQRYTKMQILENYLNEVYLGQRGARGIYGVAEGSRFYFGRDVRDLSVPEAAMLAGLLRAPNAYSPFVSPAKARDRRDTVLRLLFDAGEIDRGQRDAALASPLGVTEPLPEANDAAFFVDLVKAELSRRFPPEVLTAEGLQVHTTLDPLLQEQATASVRNGLSALEKGSSRLRREAGSDRLEAALVALHPQTGEIRALVGGRDYQQSQFNRAVQAHRQPGSAFKPIVYLAGMLSSGPAHITPASLLEDRPFTWEEADARPWSPENDGGRYLGTVTARTALEQSLNAATARVARAVGLPGIVALARNLGIESELPEKPSLVLGALEVTPLELTVAYAVFAGGGTRVAPIAIRRVESRTGEVIEGDPPAMAAAVPPEEAYLVTSMLSGVLERGTGRAVRAGGFHRPAAGKTGTTNEARDAWFVGYTPDLVAGVWVGFDQRASLGLPGSKAALPIWTSFMKQATAALPAREFPVPPGIAFRVVDRVSGRLLPDPPPDGFADVAIREAFREIDLSEEESAPGTGSDQPLDRATAGRDDAPAGPGEMRDPPPPPPPPPPGAAGASVRRRVAMVAMAGHRRSSGGLPGRPGGPA